MKIHITINDYENFDDAVALAKEALANRGEKKAGAIIHMEPHVEVLPHGGAEFDGETFDDFVLGSWRVGKD